MQIEFPNLQGIYCLLHWEGMVSWRLEWGCGGEPNEPGNFDPLNSDESSLPIRNSLSTPSEAALLPLSERSNPPTLAEETVRTSPEAVAVKDFWLSSGPPTYPSTHNSPTYTHNTHTHTHTHTHPLCSRPTIRLKFGVFLLSADDCSETALGLLLGLSGDWMLHHEP